MSRMPCSITDDPSNDYSNYEQKEGPYKEPEDVDDRADYEYEYEKDNRPTDYESVTHGY